MTDEPDYLADAQISINTNVTGAISSAISEYDALESEKDAADERSKEIGKKLNEYKTRVLPELLSAYGATSFTDAKTGKIVELELLVSSKIPKDEEAREPIIAYIESLGGGDLVKNEFSIEFGRGEEALVATFKAYLDSEEYTYTQTRGIHPQTHAAFGRERIRNGQEIDTEKAGLYVANVVVPREPKANKPKKLRGKV